MSFRKTSKKWLSLAAALAIFIAGAATPLGTKVYAGAENMLEKLRFTIEGMMGVKDDINPYIAKGVGNVLEVEGIQIKLEGLILDRKNKEITTIILIDMDTPKEEEEFGLFVEKYLVINGKKFIPSGGSGSMRLIDEKNNIYVDVFTHQIENSLPGGKLSIEVHCDEIYTMKNPEKIEPGKSGINRKIQENIIFLVSTDGKELEKENKTKVLNISVQDENYGSIELEKLTMNPLTQKLYAQWQMPSLPKGSTKEDYINYLGQNRFEIQMTTDTGAEVFFEASKFEYLSKNGKNIAMMEYEFGKVKSELTASEFFYQVKQAELQIIQNRYKTFDSEEKIETNRPFGQPAIIHLK